MEEIKRAKEQARRDVYGLSPEEREEKRKKRGETIQLAKKIAVNILNPSEELRIIEGKPERKPRRRRK